MSILLTREVARHAVELTMPAIQAMMASKEVKRGQLAIVVARPGPFPFHLPLSASRLAPDDVLYREDIGREVWLKRYDDFAEAKAILAWRTGMDTHLVQQIMPHLLISGDVKFGGGVNYRQIVVGVSGVEWQFDQLFGTWISAACYALCLRAMEPLIADPQLSYVS